MASSAASAAVTILLILSLTTITFGAKCSTTLSDPGSEKQTYLRLYFQDTYVDGPNRTAFVVASLNNPTTSFNFGDIGVLDDPLTEGPERTSKIVGRAQGAYFQASREEEGYLLTMNFVFVDGSYRGSTLAVVGRAVLQASTRDWSVVGGSGYFQNARGYIHGTLLEAPAGSLRIELDIYIMHS